MRIDGKLLVGVYLWCFLGGIGDFGEWCGAVRACKLMEDVLNFVD